MALVMLVNYLFAGVFVMVMTMTMMMTMMMIMGLTPLPLLRITHPRPELA